MNHTILTTNFHTQGGIKKVRLVFACAWCPPNKHKHLGRNEAYTHGMCSYHKKTFLKNYLAKTRFAGKKMRQ